MKRDIWDKLIEWKNKDRKQRILKGARQVGERLTLWGLWQECFLRRIL